MLNLQEKVSSLKQEIAYYEQLHADAVRRSHTHTGKELWEFEESVVLGFRLQDKERELADLLATH